MASKMIHKMTQECLLVYEAKVKGFCEEYDSSIKKAKQDFLTIKRSAKQKRDEAIANLRKE